MIVNRKRESVAESGRSGCNAAEAREGTDTGCVNAVKGDRVGREGEKRRTGGRREAEGQKTREVRERERERQTATHVFFIGKRPLLAIDKADAVDKADAELSRRSRAANLHAALEFVARPLWY